MTLITRESYVNQRGIRPSDEHLVIVMPDEPISEIEAFIKARDRFTSELAFILATDDHAQVAEIYQHGMGAQLICAGGDVIDLDECDYVNGVLDLVWIARQCGNVLICDPWSLIRQPSMIDAGEVTIKYIEESAQVANLTVIVTEPWHKMRLDELHAMGIELCGSAAVAGAAA